MAASLGGAIHSKGNNAFTQPLAYNLDIYLFGKILLQGHLVMATIQQNLPQADSLRKPIIRLLAVTSPLKV